MKRPQARAQRSRRGVFSEGGTGFADPRGGAYATRGSAGPLSERDPAIPQTTFSSSRANVSSGRSRRRRRSTHTILCGSAPPFPRQRAAWFVAHRSSVEESSSPAGAKGDPSPGSRAPRGCRRSLAPGGLASRAHASCQDAARGEVKITHGLFILIVSRRVRVGRGVVQRPGEARGSRLPTATRGRARVALRGRFHPSTRRWRARLWTSVPRKALLVPTSRLHQQAVLFFAVC